MGIVSKVIPGQAADQKKQIASAWKRIGQEWRVCQGTLPGAEKLRINREKVAGPGLNKGLGNAKKWDTLMRAPAFPCKQKAGEEGGGEGKENRMWKTVEKWQRQL